MSSVNKLEFNKFFTPDGSELITNYLTSLKKYMVKEGVDNEQIDSVINGIYEFIQEYHGNVKENRINFNTTLSLIEDIGAPTEIIQSLDYKKINIAQSLLSCPYCKMKYSIESIYCEFCGKMIQIKLNDRKNVEIINYHNLKNMKHSIKQSILDHPYSRSYLILVLFFSSIFLISGILFNIFSIYGLKNPSLFIYLNVIISIVSSLLISIFFSLAFGIYIDIFYKEMKSPKFQYNKILENFKENIVGGFIMVFLGITFFTIFLLTIPGFSSIGVFIWIFVMVTDFINFIYFGTGTIKPKTLSLYQLNLLKLKVEKINKNEYFKFNKKYILPLFVAGYLSIVIFPPHVDSVVVFLLSGFFLFTFYLLIFNGFIIMQLNSWKTLTNYPIK